MAGRSMAGAFLCAAALTTTSFTTMPAQAARTTAQAPVHYANGVTVTPDVYHDTSAPAWTLQAHPAPPRTVSVRAVPARPGPVVSSPDTSHRRSGAAAALPAVSAGFDGIKNSDNPTGHQVVPPDNEGAAGTTQYVELVNDSYAVYSKQGTVLQAPKPTNSLWSGFTGAGGMCQNDNDGDGQVLWDALAGRWVLSQFAVTGATTTWYECVAVSTSADATGTYNRYAFANSNFPDYPKMGVWADGYYTSFNMSTATAWAGSQVCAYDRVAMLAGTTATEQCVMAVSPGTGVTLPATILPATIDGAAPPAAGTPEWLVALSPTAANSLAYWRYHVDWTTPADSYLSAAGAIPVNTFTGTCADAPCIPQLDARNRKLDGVGDRLMHRLAYRNFGTYESLVVDHSIVAGTTVGVRWYELRPSGNTLGLGQQGTYAPTDTNYRWMGSIAEDKSGDMALGFSLSSATTDPGVAFTGRLASDAAGTMPQGENTIIAGGGPQTLPRNTHYWRWGDYTEMSVDPVDDCTFWYVNQYYTATSGIDWHTRIASFKFPTCGSVTTHVAKATWSSQPVVLAAQRNFTVEGLGDATLAGQITGFFTDDPAYTCLNGASLNVFTAPAEFPGSYIVHNGGQGSQCAYGTWTFPLTYYASATFVGTLERLTNVANVTVEGLPDANLVGSVSNFQTNDPALNCLDGTTLNLWTAPTEYPGLYVVHNGVQGPQCSFGTWTFPHAANYTGTWSQQPVAMAKVVNNNVNLYPDAVLAGQLSNFQTDDATFTCLDGTAVNVYTAAQEFPNLYVVHSSRPTQCADGTWTFAQTHASAGFVNTVQNLSSVSYTPISSFADATQVGTVSNFQTNDTLTSCLNGVGLNLYTAPAEYPGLYVVQSVIPQCALGSWTFPEVLFPAPQVGWVTPAAGVDTGGQVVAINGAGFTGASAVSFGGTAATAFTVESDGEIVATIPAHADGTVDVQVTVSGVTSSANPYDRFSFVPAPSVTAVSPTAGPVAGGTAVTITGRGFSNATRVIFGGTTATGFTVVSDTQINVQSPGHAAGTVDVQVTAAGVTSATGTSDRFTYS